MKIGILQTGEAPRELIDEHGDYNDMFVRLLGGPDISFATYRVLDGQLPQRTDVADAYVITGSRCGVYDGFGWIADLEDYLRALNAEKRAMAGICFGHQVMAQAFGGRVEKFEGGWSAGLETYRFKDHGDPARLLAWHQDQVIVPPREAQTLASSDFCRYAALTYGKHGLSVQPHPEFTPAFLKGLAEARRAVVGEDVAIRALKSLTKATPSAFGPYIVSFLKKAVASRAAE